MSGYYDIPPPGHGQYVHGESLEEIPEDGDFNNSSSRFTGSFDGASISQQLTTDNVTLWIEQGNAEDTQGGQKASKSRRRLPPGPDHVKHRRTRSGCYTCRSRRVKCDETHPICERCRKGQRDCTWPPDSSSKSVSSGKDGKQAEQDSESSEEDDDSDEVMLEKNRTQSDILSKARTSRSTFPAANKPSRAAITTKHVGAGAIKDKSASPTTTEDTSSLFSPVGHPSTVSTTTSWDSDSWSKLKQDHQFYLTYHQRAISYCYYFIKQDSCHLIDSTLIQAALTYEPLLNAVVGFSAFQYALVHPGKKIATFLSYYNKGLALLREDLGSSKPHTDAMIYTILQLATFEEYMGDWANLMIHQKAACELIQELYTPQSMMLTATSRALFSWYIRFDIFVGFMGGGGILIGLDWFHAFYESTKALSDAHPSDMEYRLEALNAENRVLGMNMATLFAKVPKKEISMEEFDKQNAILFSNIEDWSDRARQLRFHNSHLVKQFENPRPLTPEDIVNPFEAGVIFDAELFSANFMLMDIMALEVIHKMQTATVKQVAPPAELTRLSLQQCQVFEAIQEYEDAPTGAFLPAQVNVGLVCFFVPRDEKHIRWCRKMLARFENCGYIYPPSFRQKIADAWSMPSVKESWLDDEHQPEIIKELRAFIAARTMETKSQLSEDVRQMKAILDKLYLEESPKNSPGSASNNSSDMASSSQSQTVTRSYSDQSQDPKQSPANQSSRTG